MARPKIEPDKIKKGGVTYINSALAALTYDVSADYLRQLVCKRCVKRYRFKSVRGVNWFDQIELEAYFNKTRGSKGDDDEWAELAASL